MNENNKALLFRLIGDETRLYILEQLNQCDSCGCDMLEKLSITQPTLSHHMKLLSDNKVVLTKKVGKKVIYSLNREVFNDLTNYLKDLS